MQTRPEWSFTVLNVRNGITMTVFDQEPWNKKKKKRGPTRDPDKVASTLEEWYEISTERNSMVGNELGPSTIG